MSGLLNQLALTATLCATYHQMFSHTASVHPKLLDSSESPCESAAQMAILISLFILAHLTHLH